MGAWSNLVSELTEAITDEFDPHYRDHYRTVDDNLDACVPSSTWGLLELAQDNRDLINYKSEMGHSTVYDILNEAVYALLSEEAWRVVNELERDCQQCDNCDEKFLPDKSDACDNFAYCSLECEVEDRGVVCEACGSQYLEEDSEAEDTKRFCSPGCEKEEEDDEE